MRSFASARVRRNNSRLGYAVTFPLFDYVPQLRTRVSRSPLGVFPTAVEPLAAICRELGADPGEAWVKRDDQSSPVYGGNKVRTLELLFGDAARRGRSHVVALGAFGSNHALATALHAPRLGLTAGALLFPQPASEAACANLSALCQTTARLDAVRHWSTLPLGILQLHTRSRGADAEPYIMAPGGATPLGALGYVSAALELAEQLARREAPIPRRIVVGVGSTCTSAGLLVGLCLATHFQLGFERNNRPHLCSVRVSPWPVTSRRRVLTLALRTARLLHTLSGGAIPSFERAELGACFEVDGRFLGPGYGKPSLAGKESEALYDRLGPARLDGTYSAKAFARVVSGLREREVGPTLFWSTKSSAPLPSLATESRLEERSHEVPPRMLAFLLEARRHLA